MLTKNAAPMLGTLTPDRWGDRFRSYDRPSNAAFLRLQIRAAKAAERAALVGELEYDDEAAWAAYLDAAEDLDLDSAAFADEADMAEALDEYDPDDAYAGCLCRRCLLHDDPGGCLVIEADLAAGVTRMGELSGDDRYALDDDDLPGWGSARVAYEDFSTGFRVTDRP